MVCKKPVDLRRAEATLRLQHQTDSGRRRRLQTIQTILSHVDGKMGEGNLPTLWLIA